MERWSQLANDGIPVIIDEISGKSFKSTIRFSQAKYHHIIHGDISLSWQGWRYGLLREQPVVYRIQGALTENFVLQNLVTQKVNFPIQRENKISTVEVKSKANTNSRSLEKPKELFPDQAKLPVRFSLDNLK